jgi:hypothetical protein
LASLSFGALANLQADNSTLELLNAAGVGAEHKIVYRYFSYGADLAAKP